MSVDPEVLEALGKSLRDLQDGPARPIPAGASAALAHVAKPGTALTIDLAASETIGAPLVTVTQRPDFSGLFDPLTHRQREVAMLVVAGQSNKEIASALAISVATVKDHVHAILQRLGLSSRAAVIAAVQASHGR